MFNLILSFSTNLAIAATPPPVGEGDFVESFIFENMLIFNISKRKIKIRRAFPMKKLRTHITKIENETVEKNIFFWPPEQRLWTAFPFTYLDTGCPAIQTFRSWIISLSSILSWEGGGRTVYFLTICLFIHLSYIQYLMRPIFQGQLIFLLLIPISKANTEKGLELNAIFENHKPQNSYFRIKLVLPLFKCGIFILEAKKVSIIFRISNPQTSISKCFRRFCFQLELIFLLSRVKCWFWGLQSGSKYNTRRKLLTFVAKIESKSK